jgi:hypothetical protein
MNLKQIREKWERGGRIILVVTDHDYVGCDDHQNPHYYDTVYVVVDFGGGDNYHLHRYFPIMQGTDDERWEVSVDVQEDNIEICLDAINRAFDKRYPEGE